jgi:hypothetical protein
MKSTHSSSVLECCGQSSDNCGTRWHSLSGDIFKAIWSSSNHNGKNKSDCKNDAVESIRLRGMFTFNGHQSSGATRTCNKVGHPLAGACRCRKNFSCESEDTPSSRSGQQRRYHREEGAKLKQPQGSFYRKGGHDSTVISGEE